VTLFDLDGGADEWKSHRWELLLLHDAHGAPYGLPHGELRGAPKEVDASNVDDPPERKASRRGQDSAPEGHRTMPGEFAEGLGTGPSFDGSGNALRQE
jgi:hypothetical protein